MTIILFQRLFFYTLKYKVSYPDFFDGIDSARVLTVNFMEWYNTKHRHTGIGLITHEQRHSDLGYWIMKKRSKVMTEVYVNNPARWTNEIKSWINVKKVYLNPSDEIKEALRKAV